MSDYKDIVYVFLGSYVCLEKELTLYLGHGSHA